MTCNQIGTNETGLQCDEGKPNCKKCTSFGVSCDFESKDSELQFAGVGVFQLDVSQADIPSNIDKIIDGMMNAPLDLYVEDGKDWPSVCYIDRPHLDLLRKFQQRTVLTLGTADTSAIYQEQILLMSSQHSVVLHAVLRTTLMHDRYLFDPIGTKPSAAEAFHGYHGTALFSQKLNSPLQESEKDALWATSALLGACAFASIDAISCQDAWPLKDPSPRDMDWLKMSEGKKEVWRLANPLREGSVWRDAFELDQSKKLAAEDHKLHPELNRLYPYVTKLYHLDYPPPADGRGPDPYYTAASIVERLLPIECTYSTIVWFLSFIGHMEPAYRVLIEEKDPAALVLLSWWYAKMIPYGQWWLQRRCLFECQAVCIYLDRILPHDNPLRPLLEFPKSACGFRTYTPATASSETSDESQRQEEESWPWVRNF